MTVYYYNPVARNHVNMDLFYQVERTDELEVYYAATNLVQNGQTASVRVNKYPSVVIDTATGTLFTATTFEPRKIETYADVQHVLLVADLSLRLLAINRGGFYSHLLAGDITTIKLQAEKLPVKQKPLDGPAGSC